MPDVVIEYIRPVLQKFVICPRCSERFVVKPGEDMGDGFTSCSLCHASFDIDANAAKATPPGGSMPCNTHILGRRGLTNE